MTFPTEDSKHDEQQSDDKIPLEDVIIDDEKKAQIVIHPDIPVSKPWAEMSTKERCLSVFWGVSKGLSLLVLLYIFVCSLDLLSSSFQLLGGRATGEVFGHPLLQNPVVGLMIGVLVTVLVQSSSTSTSIVVSLVAAGYFPTIQMVIPIIMGANVGTSVTNTIVAITRIGDRTEFGRAFAGATVHDMFNWLAVIVLLIIEVTTGYLYYLTKAIMDGFNFESTGGEEIKLLKVITEPLTKAILLIDKKVLEGWAIEDPKYDNATLLKIYCDGEKCPSLFSIFALDDTTTGAIMTVLSLVLLCGCLILLVKLLQNVLQGPMAAVIQKTVNADIPYVPWLTGYIAILVGAVATFLMQSSSVFTSALTPLVGMGIISVSRTYPLTLGSNIGTTTTSILAALTASTDKLQDTLQIAFCHLFFNISGILLFYPIPFMRWPIPLAIGLGKTTAKYRWFAFAYLIGSFLLIPLIVLGLSLAEPNGYALLGVGVPIAVIIIFVVIVNLMQTRVPGILPDTLKTWEWLPLCLRSLEPIDNLLQKMFLSCKCCKKFNDQDEKGEDNLGFQIE